MESDSFDFSFESEESGTEILYGVMEGMFEVDDKLPKQIAIEVVFLIELASMLFG